MSVTLSPVSADTVNSFTLCVCANLSTYKRRKLRSTDYELSFTHTTRSGTVLLMYSSPRLPTSTVGRFPLCPANHQYEMSVNVDLSVFRSKKRLKKVSRADQ